jgi:hypothetical protein
VAISPPSGFLAVIVDTNRSGVAHGPLRLAERRFSVARRQISKIMASEGIPLWETVTRILIASALALAFGCRHAKLSRVFLLEGRSYKVCCDCGARFDYSLRTMSILPHHKLLPALRRLRARRIHRQRKFQGRPTRPE